MSIASEIRNLEQIRHALLSLDAKGTDETVTMAMTIVCIAQDFVQKGLPVKTSALLQHAKNVVRHHYEP